MLLSEVQQRTDDVTSAGATNLGIMSVTDRSGATPDTDKNSAQLHRIRTAKERGNSLFCVGETMSRTNPRHQNGNLRRKHRARLKAMQCPCGICRGRLGPIHYDEPSDAQHPLSFVIDEIRPISKWREFGYDSPAQAAQDWDNLQAAHWICNAKKSNKVDCGEPQKIIKAITISDGEW